jgi:2-iminobutanoate/2-iminopropanoate deaminase
MNHQTIDTGIAKHIGSYSDAMVAGPGLRWLYTSGTPGLTKTGDLPTGIEAQTRLAWENVFDALKQANMTTADLVKVSTSLTSAADIPAYVKVRKEVLGDVRPAFMLSIIDGMVRPGILVEIEIVAAAK